MKEEINKTIEVLNKGGVILYPTDTIWGLGCDARNVEAVKKIYEIKGRPAGKSFIVLLDTVNKLDAYVEGIPEVCFDLIEYAENPLTIVFEKAKNLPKEVINEDGSIGIRVVKSGFSHELIKKFRYPIVSTSANFSGKPSAGRPEEIEEGIKQQCDYIVNAPDSGTGKSSTILKINNNGTVQILRK